MTLLNRLLERIETDGPISLADYMNEALLDPRDGYYATRDPFGAGGDFITAPEISQMFGELLGLCLAQTWMDQGAPPNIVLAELGPGRGTLMADVLRATHRMADFNPQVVLLEASPTLRNVQAETLSRHNPVWINHIGELPQKPLFLIANEFFDALPIRQFQRIGDAWAELRIGAQDGKLVPGLGPVQPQPALNARLNDIPDGGIVEICPAAAPIMDEIGQRIAQHGGAGLILDYGDWRSKGDTFQAVKDHAPADPFAAPGTADLTAHVDFEALSNATGPASPSTVIPQGVFLERLGITERAQILAERLSGVALENHIAAHRRLTHPDEMGNLFKVLGVTPPDTAPPPGLEP